MLVLGITVVQTIHDGVVAQELVIERSAGTSFYVEKKTILIGDKIIATMSTEGREKQIDLKIGLLNMHQSTSHEVDPNCPTKASPYLKTKLR